MYIVKNFGTRSYGGDALVHPRHMNSFQIFYDIHSLTYKYLIITVCGTVLSIMSGLETRSLGLNTLGTT